MQSPDGADRKGRTYTRDRTGHPIHSVQTVWKKYIVLLKDNKTKGMLIRIRNMQARYRRMFGKKNIAEVETYRKSMENFQKAIQKYQAQLRNNNKDKIKEYL